jgi:hypothetical protein
VLLAPVPLLLDAVPPSLDELLPPDEVDELPLPLADDPVVFPLDEDSLSPPLVEPPSLAVPLSSCVKPSMPATSSHPARNETHTRPASPPVRRTLGSTGDHTPDIVADLVPQFIGAASPSALPGGSNATTNYTPPKGAVLHAAAGSIRTQREEGV